MILQKYLHYMKNQKIGQKRATIYRNMIRKEAKIGGELFGPVAKGGRREFFCLDEHTWVWHEEWRDETGQLRTKTTRYDVRPNGILKAQNDQHYEFVSPQEAQHLYEAAQLYIDRVGSQMYHFAV